MGTGIMHSEGEYDAPSQTLTEVGESTSPMGNVRMKMVSKDIDENKFVFTMFVTAPDGNEMKTMEITYTRL